ncbi:acetyl-CoA hydrolase/transferase C-terminal domain-containing protein [Gordonia polyisoprenivorans]|uniref:acetyl-CoA hydrolase/transferase C-terminal domain-containing protein n=1 Tax=Gordonia polyisoprenivorans TaxID=84595 RepID=UPI001AD7DA4D|nr:acetyl-CoA hydrolase/transferase C-terminal domain-containing protein [Gordonia polyisoprenivorans]QTI69926.1 acetyl-CoA hydrolase [Gordonia polyisoprenivorans]
MGNSTSATIAAQLRPGMRVAIADGAGAPLSLVDDLTDAARSVGGISLVLGWCLALPVRLDRDAFTDIRTVMGGFALQPAIDDGVVRRVPARLGGLPSLLTGPLRPDLLIAGLTRDNAGWHWGTEVSWMASVVDAGVPVLAEHNEALPRTSGDPVVPQDQVTVVSHVERSPIAVPSATFDDTSRQIAAHIADLVPEGACVQYGPGPLADAVFDALTVPIRIRSGMINQSVLSLERRGLLLDTPVSTYVVGSPEVYVWADGRAVTTRLEKTHDLSVARGRPFVTINTALEVDTSGAVNIEGIAGRAVAGPGGHPDFALAGHRSVGGLSIIATPSTRRGRRTLVDRLTFPASTPRSDVDIVVTEHGRADLRGLDDVERAAELARIWSSDCAAASEPC